MRWPSVSMFTLALALAASGRADEVSQREARFEAARGLRRLLPLIGASELEDASVNGGEDLVILLRRAADDPQPLVAARARAELATMLARRGQRDAVQGLVAQVGLIERVAVVGPFLAELGAELPASDKVGDERALLTSAIGPHASFASSIVAQPATVYLPTNLGAHGIVPLGAWLRPDTRIAAFALIGVDTSRPMDVVLRVGSSGAIKVWADGVLLGSHDGDRPLALDASSFGAHLSAGHHRFVVRVATSDREPDLFLRLTDDAGNALALPPSDPLLAVHGSASARRTPSIASLLGPDRDAYVVLDGIDGSRPQAPCGRIAGKAPLDAALRCAVDDDERRRVLETHLEQARGVTARVDVLTQLGELAVRGRTPALGEARLQEAVRIGGEHAWLAHLRLIEQKADHGLPLVAAEELDALVQRTPTIRAREVVAHLAQRVGKSDVALEVLGVLLTRLPGDVSLLRQVAALERARGRREDLQHALASLDGPHDARDVESLAVERAEILEGLGRVDEAAHVIEQLLTLAPGDARIEERLGRLLLGAPATRAQGLVHLRRALALRPQSPELRGLLAEVDASEQDKASDLRRAYAVDVTRLREHAQKDALGRGDIARVLYDGTTVRVHDNGLQEQFVERVVEVGDRRGAEEEGTVYVRYAPDSQSVEVAIARIYKPSGEIIETASIEEQDLSEPWAGLYYDVRAQVVHLVGVEPGDIVHVAYTVSDHGRRNELGDAFFDLHMMQEGMARLESVYRLIAPSARTIYFNEPRVGSARIEPKSRQERNERITEFVATDVPKYVSEPGMPGETELGAYVHVSTFAKWSDVADFYRGLARTQLEPDAEIRRAALAAVRGMTDVADKVAAIYDLVVRSTRYVGLEFGVHGYQPYKVSQVWARRFGDCKDKASLLVAMLKEVGVPATMVLLRTRHEGAIGSSPPSLAIFDHAIAYVPALDRYLDGTAELSGSRELPAQDQGVFGLHANDGVLHTTPVLGPESARSTEHLDVTLAADGSGVVALHRVVAGEAAEAWRRQYQPVAQRKERLEQAWAQRSPGAEVQRVTLDHFDDRERPVELDAQIKLPRVGRHDGEHLLAVPVLVREPQLVDTLGRLSTRTTDLLLSHSLDETEQVVLQLPHGARAILPEPTVVTSRFGRFSLTAKLDGDRVLVSAETVLAVRRVTVADYAEFRAFLIAIDRAVGGELRVELAP